MKTIIACSDCGNKEHVINLDNVLFVERIKGKVKIYFSSTLNIEYNLEEDVAIKFCKQIYEIMNPKKKGWFF